MAAYIDTVARAPLTLTGHETKLLLQVTGERVAGLRDHVLYSLALATGLREHELVALNIGDVFDAQGRAKRRVTLLVFKGSKKKNTEDEAGPKRSRPSLVPQETILSDAVRAKLEKLLLVRQRAGETILPESPVFVSRLNRRLSTRQVRHGIVVWQRQAGFERRVNFHMLRHTACSNLQRRTNDLRLTQRFGRHVSIQTTTRYTHPTDEDLVRGVQLLPC